MESSPSTRQDEGPVQQRGSEFRAAMVQSCAQLLGKTVSDLKLEYEASQSSSHGAFAKIQLELAPRDLSDFIIVSALKSQNLTSIKNACSWLFNLMDRTGAGYVLRDEFIRYAPHMSPVADAAVAATIFEQLVTAEGESAPAEPEFSGSTETIGEDAADSGIVRLLRRRKRLKPQPADKQCEAEVLASPSQSMKGLLYSSSGSPVRNLFPPSLAFRFPVWSKYYLSVVRKYHETDDEWARVKREVGIDADEILVKSENAVVHAELLPTMGKLFMSQRYLVFFAAVGRNHYVARLGAIAKVQTNAIPLLARDCFEIHLQSETHAALVGITGSQALTSVPGEKPNGMRKQQETLSEHIGNLMRQYTSGDKPLSFSLMEFRDTSRRDNWVLLLKELIEAHELHLRMGFGSTGRGSALRRRNCKDGGEDDSASDTGSTTGKVIESGGMLTNYLRSPFRNEPPTPLLVVAAHASIARFRALRHIVKKREPRNVLLFSHADRHPGKVTWYVDSVRQYDDWSEKGWIERLVASIQENMEANNRVYRAMDERPFDLALLAQSIGRFAELCSPLALFIQYLNYLFQWQNPPATVLAIMFCIAIAALGYVKYVPAMVIFGQAWWVIEAKVNWFGLGIGRQTAEDVEEQQQNVLEMVAQVHDALQAAQNVIGKLNNFFGKIQTLFLWRSEEWQSWAAVAVVLFFGFVLMLIPVQFLFMYLVFFMFGKHFLPPSNPVLRFWNKIPSNVNANR